MDFLLFSKSNTVNRCNTILVREQPMQCAHGLAYNHPTNIPEKIHIGVQLIKIKVKSVGSDYYNFSDDNINERQSSSHTFSHNSAHYLWIQLYGTEFSTKYTNHIQCDFGGPEWNTPSSQPSIH